MNNSVMPKLSNNAASLRIATILWIFVFLFSANCLAQQVSTDDTREPWEIKVQQRLKADPKNGKDSDGDGLSDEYEVSQTAPGYKTDPYDADSDDDGLSDGEESGYLRPGIWQFQDQVTNLHPMKSDSDGDGLPDGLELGLTSPIPDKGRIKGTDPKATFTFLHKRSGTTETLVRRCFISDADPLSITDPGSMDSNADGIFDGDQDANGNGQFDLGETDPAAGLISWAGWGTPQSLLASTQTLQRVYLNGKIAEEKDTSSIEIAFQSSADCQPPRILISKPECLRVNSIQNKRGTRIWIVNLEWQSESKDAIGVYLLSQALINGRTGPIRFRTLPAKHLENR